MNTGLTPLLRLVDVDAWYGHFQALRGIDLTVHDGETVAVIGANGAGKTTLLRSVMGTVTLSPQSRVELAGVELGSRRPHERVREGVTLVPEGRKLFPSLTVRENLEIAATRARGRWDLDSVYDLFPNLPLLARRAAGSLSGGEQQAVAIGRGLVANPRVLMLDEVSLGLAPVVVERLYGALAEIASSGMTMLVVEQDVGQALRIAKTVLCLRAGATVLAAPAAEVTAAAVTAAYFGASA
ncbi:ABC transporter ATP-binding protein [Pseudonocardia sp. TRM90224]|uniref:ABC transporter ATP-binding protein n=1 Tax=Pseudonocardia sp. TRM90224 TaxID=2812678 RepID=UPI001E4EAB52|nr:ABC transporter ATP-binding protein [Pseudonocardia sp. TRM90224]